jgi:signal transduction histidine kinase
VALAATVLIGIVYAGCAAALDALLAGRSVAQVDARLTDNLSDGHRSTSPQAGSDEDDQDVDGAPLFLWLVRPGTATVTLSPHAPPLPGGIRPVTGRPWTAQIGLHPFLLAAARQASGQWLVAGQSMAEEAHFQSALVDGEVLAAPVLLLAVFAGSVIIGLRALAPVEQSRRRQLEFTADASHELRTPLSVISAETNLALSSPRGAAAYRSALTRIQGESQRLRTIVEDLLWLARFDSHPPLPDNEPIDLGVITGQCADRFRAVASAESIEIMVTTAAGDGGSSGDGGSGDGGAGDGSAGDGSAGDGPAWMSAPTDWIDRLAGVLMDNACRYAGPGGRVRIAALAQGNWVSLVVEDSGPGISPEDRPRLFDRFHRATEHGGGAGLGLAIGDSIVRSTGGRWKIGESPLGGARVEVCWRRAQLRPDHRSAAGTSTGAGPGRGANAETGGSGGTETGPGGLEDLVNPAMRIRQGSELDP